MNKREGAKPYVMRRRSKIGVQVAKQGLSRVAEGKKYTTGSG